MSSTVTQWLRIWGSHGCGSGSIPRLVTLTTKKKKKERERKEGNILKHLKQSDSNYIHIESNNKNYLQLYSVHHFLT